MSSFGDELRALASKKSNPVSKDKDQKNFDLILDQEEQKSIKDRAVSVGKSSLPAIEKALDYINRPFAASRGYLKGAIEDLQDDTPLSIESIKMSKAIKGLKDGWSGKEHVGTREVLETAFPETMKKIHDATNTRASEKNLDLLQGISDENKMRLFGSTSAGELPIQGIDADALSVPIFIADIITDPVSWATGPVKGVLKATGKISSAATDLMVKASESLAPHTTAKALESLSKAQDVASSIFNYRGLIKKYIPEASEAYDKLLRAGNVGASISKRENDILRELAVTTEKDSKELYHGLQEVSDGAKEFMANLRAKNLGVAVEDMNHLDDLEKVSSDIVDLESQRKGLGSIAGEDYKNIESELKAKRSELESLVKDKKTARNPTVVSKILEERGLKNEANQAAKFEKEANLELSKARLDFVEKQHKYLSETIANQKSGIEDVLSGKIQGGHKLLQSEIQSTKSMVKEMNQQVRSIAKGSSGNIEPIMNYVENKISRLDKYQLDSMKRIEGLDRETTSLRKMKAMLNEYQRDLTKLRSGTIKQGRKQLVERISNNGKVLMKELDSFSKQTSSELTELAKSGKKVNVMNREALRQFQEDHTILSKMQKNVDSALVSEKLNHARNLQVAEKISNRRADTLYRNFRSLQRGALERKTTEDYLKASENIEENLIRKSLPPKLWNAARKVRSKLNEYRLDLFDKGISKGFVPGYFPRSLVKEDIEKISSSTGMYRPSSGGGSLKKSRYFGTNKEAQEWARANKVKFEDDSQVLLTNYIQNAEMAKAKYLFEQQVMGRYGLKNMSDLPKNPADRASFLRIKNMINDVYSKGRSLYPNEAARLGGELVSKLTGSVKAALTVWNPAFFGRNTGTQGFLMARGAGMKEGLLFSISNAEEGFQLLANNPGSLTRRVGGKLETVNLDDMRKAFDESGILASSFTRTDVGMSRNATYGRHKWLKNPMAKFFTMVGESNQKVDDMGRAAAFVANWKAGKSIPEALEAARSSMVDVNLMNSPFDRSMQGLLGFYSWSRKNFPQEIKNLLNNPEQYSMVSRIVEKLSNREHLTDREMNQLNSYETSTLKFLGQSIDGIRHFYSFGMHPAEDAYSTLNSVFSFDGRGLTNKLNPAVSAFLDWSYGEDSFTGKPFGNQLSPKYTSSIGKSKRLMQVLGLSEKEVPHYENGVQKGTDKVLVGPVQSIFLIRRIPYWSRQLGDASELIKGMDDGEALRALVGYFTGIKQRVIDINKREASEGYRVHDAMVEASKAKGIGKEFKTFYIPKAEKKALKEKAK